MSSISCIIPVYKLESGKNWKRFVALLNSIYLSASKLLPEQFELIIVDDDPKIKYFNKIKVLLSEIGLVKYSIVISNSKNMGQDFSRNKGCEIASKEFLHFIDQDDYINASFYEVLKDDIKEDLLISYPMFYLENTNKNIKAITNITKIMYKKALYLNNLWPLLCSNIFYSPGQIIISKTKFIESGSFPILKNHGSDDYALLYNLAMNKHISTHYMQQAIFYYRIHDDQNSKLLNMNNSINEFFSFTPSFLFKEKIIRYVKTSALWHPFAIFLYVLFFKRAPRSFSK